MGNGLLGTPTSRGTAPALTPAVFTLLELLVVLALAALFLTALLSTLQTAFFVRERTDAAVAAQIALQHWTEIASADLRQIVTPGDAVGGNLTGTCVDAGGRRLDTLVFPTAANSARIGTFGGDTIRVSYDLRATDAGQTRDLVRGVWRNPLALRAEDPEESILLRDVISLEFAYCNGKDWLDSWDTTLTDNQLPHAIRVAAEVDLPRQSPVPVRTVFTVSIFLQPAPPPAAGGAP